MQRLIESLTDGFDIGYRGPQHEHISPNVPSAAEQPDVITNHLLKECEEGRMEGPFTHPPLPNVWCSGLGVVPKKDGDWRVIYHLSAPYGLSINDFIDPQEFSLCYSSVEDAIKMCNEVGRRTLLAKIDLKNAFRQCSVRVKDWHLLGIHWANNFYFDKFLPFGLRSAPHHFDSLATALEYIIKEHTNSPHVIHYLDDFLFAGPPGCDTCTTVFTATKALCARLGITIKLEKCVAATTCITFLGIELDTVAQVARLPRDKLVELLAELQTFVE